MPAWFALGEIKKRPIYEMPKAGVSIVADGPASGLLFARREAEWRVKRAKSNQARQQKDSGQNGQDRGGHARNLAGEIKISDDGGENQPHDPVNHSHIGFHKSAPFGFP